MAVLTSALAACGQVTSIDVTGSKSSPEAQPGTRQLRSAELVTGSVQQAEPSQATFVPGLGLVRGTPEALQALSSPLVPAAASSQTAQACRTALEQAAGPLGARQVEVVPAGPRQPRPGGGFVAPVEVRILYGRTLVYEVRHSVLSCTVDAQGRLVQASPLSPPANYRQTVWAGMRDFSQARSGGRTIVVGRPKPAVSGWHVCAKLTSPGPGPLRAGERATVFVLQDGAVVDVRQAGPSDCRERGYTPLAEISGRAQAS